MHVPDPVVAFEEEGSEYEALLAESVGLALLAVLDAFTPAERLAFVLHDVFGVPFADIATTLDRSEAAAQQLASRPRRRLRNSPEPDCDLARQRRVVDASLAASRGGDFDALLEVLDPHVELRIDGGALRADASSCCTARTPWPRTPRPTRSSTRSSDPRSSTASPERWWCPTAACSR